MSRAFYKFCCNLSVFPLIKVGFWVFFTTRTTADANFFQFFRLRAEKIDWGKPLGVFPKPFSSGGNSCFPQTPLRFFAYFASLRSASSRASRSSPALRAECAASLADASGGLKPFSEEKGFKTSKKTFVRCAALWQEMRNHRSQKPSAAKISRRARSKNHLFFAIFKISPTFSLLPLCSIIAS